MSKKKLEVPFKSSFSETTNVSNAIKTAIRAIGHTPNVAEYDATTILSSTIITSQEDRDFFIRILQDGIATKDKGSNVIKHLEISHVGVFVIKYRKKYLVVFDLKEKNAEYLSWAGHGQGGEPVGGGAKLPPY